MRNRKESSAIVELDGRVSNLAVATSKPFDVLAEGLLSEKSRGDKTPLELFLAGVRGWDTGLRRRLDDGKPKPD